MPKTIKAPKSENTKELKDLNTKNPPKLNNPKTYKTSNTKRTKKHTILGTFLIIIFNILVILGVLLAIITYIQGYVYIPKFLVIKEHELDIPKKTNKKKIVLRDSHLTKWQVLKVNIQNSINNKNYTLIKDSQIQAQLSEGINTITLQKIINLKIIKFGSSPKTITTTVDTSAPQLLSKPKITNQGLVLEFTEPAILKVLKPFKRTFKTDDSYTIIIPLNLIRETKSLTLEVIDNLGNSKRVVLILNKKQTHTKQLIKYTKKELPKSAGILENVNIIGAITLFTILSIPSLFVISTNKLKQNRA